jgi:hypothetical protein
MSVVAIRISKVQMNQQLRALRLQSLATIYAALHTAPRAREKGLAVEDLVKDAKAILAALEEE